MVRKLALLLISAALCAPGGAFALGLGEIHLKSALNQTFDAKIDLLSVKPDELDGIKVTLATPEAFERAGVDRLFILTKLRYEPGLDEEGRPVIHVTSRQAIREPFLNFLVEVNWAKGRLVREYTVLLDPPVTLDRQPAAVTAPAMARAEPAAGRVQPPAPERPGPVPQRVAPVAEARSPAYPAAGTYGPVTANESLWGIASKTKPEGATVEQMMMALQRKNPQAFAKRNINNLKRGSILRMPTQEEIDLLSVHEARAEFRNQVAEWKADRATAVAASGAGDASGVAAEEAAPVPDGKLELASARPEGEGEGGGSEGDGTEEITSRLENELILAREQLESAKQEREDLSAQVSQLESQLADLESLLVVRNEQLARLQGELSRSRMEIAPETGDAPPAAEAVAGEDEIELEMAADDGEELEIIDTEGEGSGAEEIAFTDQQPAQPEQAPAAPQQAVPPPPAASETATGDSIFDTLKGLLENNMIAAAGGGLALLLLLLLLIRRRNAEKEEFEESILIDTQGGDTESLAGPVDDTEAAVSEAAETSFLSEFSHSDMDVLQDDTGEVDPVAEADVYIAYGRYQQAEELLRQAIERDPGQTKSYLKLLEILFVTKNVQAFTETAELLAAKKEEGQVDAEAWQQVVAMGHQLDPGHKLFADAEGVATQPSPAEEAAAEMLEEDEEEELDLVDLSELTAGLEADASPADLAQEESSISALLEEDGLDLDLDLGLEAEKKAGETDLDSALLNTGLSEMGVDAGLDEALLDTQPPGGDAASERNADAESSELEESLSLEGLDLGDPFEIDESALAGGDNDPETLLGESEDLAAELSSLAGEPVAPETPGSETPPSGDELDVGDLGAELEELGGLEESLSLDDLAQEHLEQQEPLEEGLETDGLMLDELESGLPESEMLEPLASDEGLIMEDEPASSLLVEEPFSELVEEPDEIDKINTKLDLARAYVEMGDEEGARSILDEVLSEGNEAQKSDAQELLGRLS